MLDLESLPIGDLTYSRGIDGLIVGSMVVEFDCPIEDFPLSFLEDKAPLYRVEANEFEYYYIDEDTIYIGDTREGLVISYSLTPIEELEGI